MSDSEPGPLLRIERDGAVAHIVLDRPAKLNALTLAMVARLDALCGELEADRDVRAVVLRSTSSRAFCAGADVHEWSVLGAEGMWRRWIADGHRVFARLAREFPAQRVACPVGSDRALDGAILTHPDMRDPALVARLQTVAGRVLRPAGAA